MTSKIRNSPHSLVIFLYFNKQLKSAIYTRCVIYLNAKYGNLIAFLFRLFPSYDSPDYLDLISTYVCKEYIDIYNFYSRKCIKCEQGKTVR